MRVNLSCGLINDSHLLCEQDAAGIKKKLCSDSEPAYFQLYAAVSLCKAERDRRREVKMLAWLHVFLFPACSGVFVHAERRPDGGVNKGLQWVCSAAGSHLSHHMKTIDVGSLLTRGLSRQSRGGVALLLLRGGWGCLCYLPIDREAMKGNFSLPIPPALPL